MTNLAQLLLHQFVQISIVVAMALLVDQFLMRRNWSRIRYVLWLLVVVKMLTPPIISSPTGLFSIAQMTCEVPNDCGVVVIDGWLTSLQNEILSYPLLMTIGVAIWLTGVAVLFVVWAIRLRAVSRRPSHDEQGVKRCQSIIRQISDDLGIDANPKVAVTTSNFGPAVYGLFRPSIVIPENVLANISDEELRPVLAHEMIHIVRRDTWVGLLQLFAAILWWFHPLAWVAIRRMSNSLEVVTDDDVVSVAGVNEHDYAHSLLSVIESGMVSPPVTGTVGIFSCQVTESRIRRLIDRRTRRSRKIWSLGAALVLAFILLPGRGLLLSDASPPGGIASATSEIQIESTD